jgi:hypothetical protein
MVGRPCREGTTRCGAPRSGRQGVRHRRLELRPLLAYMKDDLKAGDGRRTWARPPRRPGARVLPHRAARESRPAPEAARLSGRRIHESRSREGVAGGSAPWPQWTTNGTRPVPQARGRPSDSVKHVKAPAAQRPFAAVVADGCARSTATSHPQRGKSRVAGHLPGMGHRLIAARTDVPVPSGLPRPGAHD